MTVDALVADLEAAIVELEAMELPSLAMAVRVAIATVRDQQVVDAEEERVAAADESRLRAEQTLRYALTAGAEQAMEIPEA